MTRITIHRVGPTDGSVVTTNLEVPNLQEWLADNTDLGMGTRVTAYGNGNSTYHYFLNDEWTLERQVIGP